MSSLELDKIAHFLRLCDAGMFTSGSALTEVLNDIELAQMVDDVRQTRIDGLYRAYQTNREHLEIDHAILKAIHDLHAPMSCRRTGEEREELCRECLQTYPCKTIWLYDA